MPGMLGLHGARAPATTNMSAEPLGRDDPHGSAHGSVARTPRATTCSTTCSSGPREPTTSRPIAVSSQPSAPRSSSRAPSAASSRSRRRRTVVWSTPSRAAAEVRRPARATASRYRRSSVETSCGRGAGWHALTLRAAERAWASRCRTPAGTLSPWIPARPPHRPRRRRRCSASRSVLLVARRTRAVGGGPGPARGPARGRARRVRAEEAAHRSRSSRPSSPGCRRPPRACASRSTRSRSSTASSSSASAPSSRRRPSASAPRSKVLQALTPVQEIAAHDAAEGHRARDAAQPAARRALAAAPQRRPSPRSACGRPPSRSRAALRNNATRGVWGETQLRTLVRVGRADRTASTSTCSESIDVGRRRAPPRHGAPPPRRQDRSPSTRRCRTTLHRGECDPRDRDGRGGGSPRVAAQPQHAKRIKAHVDALAGKAYWTGLEASPEFTIAFIPNESLARRPRSRRTRPCSTTRSPSASRSPAR